jgi:hypothetical protein
MSGNVPGNGRYVPMNLYLEDRRRGDARLDRMEAKLDTLIVAVAEEDGREVAEEAAAAAVQENRRSRREIARDAGLCIFSAALAVGVHLITTAATGG